MQVRSVLLVFALIQSLIFGVVRGILLTYRFRMDYFY